MGCLGFCSIKSVVFFLLLFSSCGSSESDSIAVECFRPIRDLNGLY